MTRRIRTCKDCGKRLGSTVACCYECGGENPNDSMTDIWGVSWKIDLGVKTSKIFNHHSRDKWNNR